MLKTVFSDDLRKAHGYFSCEEVYRYSGSLFFDFIVNMKSPLFHRSTNNEITGQ
jgi:hypothetical protein